MTTVEFPNEVVTKARLRFINVPGLDGEAALITLDNGFDHTKPNTFGPAGLGTLDEAITEALAHEPKVRFIAVTGKPYILCVGADLTGMPHLKTRDQAMAIGEMGHKVFGRLRESAIPTFAFINGASMGGGLEVALHCRYRTVSSGAAALALPEVFLGLIPGWGGSQLLPRLIGPAAAAKVYLENPLNQNKMLKPGEALKLGIADQMYEPADFLERSLEWAASVVNGAPVERRPIDPPEVYQAVVAAGRAQVEARQHNAAPASVKALDLLELAGTADLDAGFAVEKDVLADLMMSEELRSGLYSFDLVQRRAKRPVGAPDKALARPVTKVGIVGAGLMASQLALLFLRRLEVPVAITDVDQERVDKGVGYVNAEIDKLVAKGRLSADRATKYRGLLTGATDKAGFADADFIIEAVFEDMKVKKQVFAELEAVASETAVFATNTSSLSISEMAADLKHPERVVGFHFFNPVAIMPLLEIGRGTATDDASLATAFAVGKSLKKSCVLVKDAPGFVVNRLLMRFLGEVFTSVDEGTDLEVADHALDPLGLPMSPFVLLQLVGTAVPYHTSQTMAAAFPDRYKTSDNLRRIVEAGKNAVYTWSADGKPSVDPEVAALLEQGDVALTSERVRERALSALAQEIRIMLDEGIVTEPQDIDLCMILGAGWPFHLGGITPYLDRSGISEAVTGKRFLPQGVASLPA